MNPELEVIFSRRSIRKYTDQVVTESEIRDILEAGMAAPSAVCKDPWRFVVVTDKETRREISNCLPNGKMLANASVGIVVCGALEEAHASELSYLLQDCTASIQNMLIAVNKIELGACWLGVHPREDRILKIREILGIPDKIIPLSILSIGHYVKKEESRTRYDKNKVHYEKW